MRPLAEFVMKGRIQAIGVAAVSIGSVLFAWIGAAVVALVTLRKGFAQGLQVMMWAALPALVVSWYGDVGPLAMLLGTTAAAVVLRASNSWPLALVSVSALGLLMVALLAQFGGAQIDAVHQIIESAVSQWLEQMPAEQAALISVPTQSDVIAWLSISSALSVVVSLILGRWWQALLYNPGGFQQEFHALRIPAAMTVGLVMVAMLLVQWLPEYRYAAILMAIPLLLAALGLAHALANYWSWGKPGLSVFYAVVLLVNLSRPLLLLLAVVDSWLDVRRRLPTRDTQD